MNALTYNLINKLLQGRQRQQLIVLSKIFSHYFNSLRRYGKRNLVENVNNVEPI